MRKETGKVLAVLAGLVSLVCLVMLVVCTVLLLETGEMSYALNSLTVLICGGVCLFWAGRFWSEAK